MYVNSTRAINAGLIVLCCISICHSGCSNSGDNRSVDKPNAEIKIGNSRAAIELAAKQLEASEISNELAIMDTDSIEIWEFPNQEIVLGIEYDTAGLVDSIQYWNESDFEKRKTKRDELAKEITSISIGKNSHIMIEKRTALSSY
jgi:hypothetical protein